MMSLFSPFDSYFTSFLVMSFFIFVLIFFNQSYKISLVSMMMEEVKNLNMFFISLKPKSFSKGMLFLLYFLVLSIFLINFVSVFSFVFPLTSQFGIIFLEGLLVWLSFIVFSTFQNSRGFLFHLIPEGAPIFLSIVLFVIELTSNIIRPITLSVRLASNILAGHLLMILLSNLIFNVPMLFPLYIVLNMVELFVAMIQSYIFCTMISLYFSEMN